MLGTSGVAEEHRQKIDHLIPSEPLPCKANLLIDFVENAVLPKVRRQQHKFSEPRRRCGNRCARGLDTDRSIGDTGHRCASLRKRICFFLLKKAHGYLCSLPAIRSLRIAWAKRHIFTLARYGLGSSLRIAWAMPESFRKRYPLRPRRPEGQYLAFVPACVTPVLALSRR
jgi:hypothetical protein